MCPTPKPQLEVGKVYPPQVEGQLGGARPQTQGFAAETALITGESKRTKYTARRKQIREAMCLTEKVELGGKTLPTQKATERKDRPQNQKGFAAETAAVTGESKRSINQSLAVAAAIGEQAIDRVTGTSLDSGVELTCP